MRNALLCLMFLLFLGGCASSTNLEGPPYQNPAHVIRLPQASNMPEIQHPEVYYSEHYKTNYGGELGPVESVLSTLDI